LRFLGWWRAPIVTLEHQDKLDQYVTWMRSERGFTPATVEHWSRTIGRFLRWLEQKNHDLAGLTVRDIDEYFVVEGMGRWCRVSVANTASPLRGFLRFAASRGFCANGLALPSVEDCQRQPNGAVISGMIGITGIDDRDPPE
jgi:integrase/recombinase XerD